MCAPMIGAAVGAIGSVMSGVMAQQSANYQAKVAEINAEAAMREGYAQAGATRDQFREVKGQQVAALAKSGVDINSGSATVLGLETQRREEVAAAVDIWRGKTEQVKYKNQAAIAKAEGKAAMIGGIIGGVSSLVGGMQGAGQGSALKLGQAAPATTGVTSNIIPIPRQKPRIPIGSLTFGGPR